MKKYKQVTQVLQITNILTSSAATWAVPVSLLPVDEMFRPQGAERVECHAFKTHSSLQTMVCASQHFHLMSSFSYQTHYCFASLVKSSLALKPNVLSITNSMQDGPNTDTCGTGLLYDRKCTFCYVSKIAYSSIHLKTPIRYFSMQYNIFHSKLKTCVNVSSVNHRGDDYSQESTA